MKIATNTLICGAGMPASPAALVIPLAATFIEPAADEGNAPSPDVGNVFSALLPDAARAANDDGVPANQSGSSKQRKTKNPVFEGRAEMGRRLRMAQIEPLRREVSKRITCLISEREHCDTSILARRRAAQMNMTGGNRHAALTAAGLTAEQIRSLGPERQSPEDQEAALKTRMESIDAELAPLHEFAETGDPAHLAGLDFGGLVEAAFPGRAVEAAA